MKRPKWYSNLMRYGGSLVLLLILGEFSGRHVTASNASNHVPGVTSYDESVSLSLSEDASKVTHEWASVALVDPSTETAAAASFPATFLGDEKVEPPMEAATPEPLYTEQEILNAIRLVESGGDDNCPDGDWGRSIGPFQIGQLYWQDANSFSPAGGHYEQCRNREYAESVVRRYMQRYVPEAWIELDAETIARTHNGGPRGVFKVATLPYWKKVQRALAAGRNARLVARR